MTWRPALEPGQDGSKWQVALWQGLLVARGVAWLGRSEARGSLLMELSRAWAENLHES
jgi:hypothetical protein